MNQIPLISNACNNLIEAFYGRWQVTRSIHDRLGLGRITFEGEAVIGPDHFEEHGETLINGHRSRSRRAYKISLADAEVIVQFPDGREFIRLGASPLQRVRHLCGEDDYQGRLLFSSHAFWMESWDVVGPRKSYRSIARYRRD
ncbi:DUF6314 family protein [Neorhizobium alkalisoli]|uniref:DUF6314 family protein n=1 Tax=Neorhizobium alkalisoli TaxID=528178 RepID=UPI00119D3862|nr:DUF6314 family protein [Neorhizobium alkalisoli]